MSRYWFGTHWGAPMLEDATKVSTPVGQPCLHCEVPIAEGDDGVLMPVLDTKGARTAPLHRECDLRMVVGSVGHQLKKCSCFGGHMDEPPGMNRRDGAIAAETLFVDKRGYWIRDGAITCFTCGKTSYNIHDVIERYCGTCRVFHRLRDMGRQMGVPDSAWGGDQVD